jgi:phosphoglycerol geranylgeranyltransferase
MPEPGRELIAIGPVEKRLVEMRKKGPICAALIDPENFSPKQAAEVASKAISVGASLILIGGSTLANQGRLDAVVNAVKNHVARDKSHVPIVLFPGNITGVSRYADAILFSSLLNSTNPYFIIGAQALGSTEVYKAGIESIPMGYLIFGNSTAASFIGQVNSLPASKPELAVIYSLAAKYLGMRTLYLEAGSGAGDPVPPEIIRAVRQAYDGILLVGGGITTADTAKKATKSGADILVVGNLLQSSGFERPLKEITISLRKEI